MARAAERLAANVPGDFFVDASCIDCDLCRQLAPATFARDAAAGQSVVARQPAGASDEQRALVALVTCPTSSIGTARKHDVRAAAAALPERVTDDVYFCGYAAESSFGASAWLIRRPSGNVLVDVPRAARPLLARLDALGGVRTIFLTHRDDVADHDVLARRFGAERIIHRDDDEIGAERVLDGVAPVALDAELTAIPVPGHTRGSVALLWRDVLFTGDHLAADDERDGELDAWPGVCWYSWSEQTRSMERLLAHRFAWVLPGHGRRFHAAPDATRAALERLIARMHRTHARRA
jgi:glyoxylase-like metal-dependent hydrolase (beta-lactamase superfamily II)/ferredoxin